MYLLQLGIFMSYVSLGVHTEVFKKFLISRVCNANYGFNDTTCDHPEQTPSYDEIEKHVTYLMMAWALIGIIPGVISTMSLSAWSDFKRKRKFLLIWPMIGTLFNRSVILLVSWIPVAKAEWVLIALLSQILGGLKCVVVGALAIVSDSSSESARMSRIFSVEACLILGMSFGSLISAPIFSVSNYQTVFGVAVVIDILATLTFVLGVEEPFPIHNRTEETLIEENSAILCSLLKQRLKSILKAFIRFFCRLGRNKKIIFILLFSASVVEIFIDAQGDLTYFYTRDKLQWTMSEFTGWNFYDAAIKLAVSAAAIRRFNLYESSLGICGSLSGVISFIIIAELQTSWEMYLCKGNTVSAAYTGELGTGHFLRYKRKFALTGDIYFKIRLWGFKNLRYKRKSGLTDYGLSGGHSTVIGAITKCAFVVIKSSLSKMYPESDGGKVFSALSSVQAVVPFVSRPLVTALFNRENHEASAYFFTSAMFFVLMTIFLLIRLVRTRDQNDYEAVDGDVHPEL